MPCGDARACVRQGHTHTHTSSNPNSNGRTWPFGACDDDESTWQVHTPASQSHRRTSCSDTWLSDSSRLSSISPSSISPPSVAPPSLRPAMGATTTAAATAVLSCSIGCGGCPSPPSMVPTALSSVVCVCCVCVCACITEADGVTLGCGGGEHGETAATYSNA